MSAPYFSKMRNASTLPVLDAIIRGVSPFSESLACGSAPAFNNSSIIGPLPLMHAKVSGVTPRRSAALTFAPAAIREAAISKSSHRAAQ